MPTSSTSGQGYSTAREVYDTINVLENKKWLGSADLVHDPKPSHKVAPLVHERLVVVSTSTTFSRVSSSYCQIKIPRQSGDFLGNIYLNYDRAACTQASITTGAGYALDFELYQSIARIRFSYRGREFWSVTGDQMYSQLMELSDKEKAAIAVTAAGFRSRQERKKLCKTDIHLAGPILTPWHNMFDKMFPLRHLVDDILVEISFKEDQYVFHTPSTLVAGAISGVNLNLDVYHEDPVKSRDTEKAYKRGGGRVQEYIFDEWQLHQAEPWAISDAQTTANMSLKLDNLTGQIYKLLVQVRSQKHLTTQAYLHPNYTEPIDRLVLQSNNRDIVVQEYHYDEVYGKTPDTMQPYYSYLMNPENASSGRNVDRQFRHMPLCPPQFDSLNKDGAAGTRQLSLYTAPTLTVYLVRASSGLNYNIHAPSFVDEGGANDSNGVAPRNKYLTVIGLAKNAIQVGDGDIKRLFAMR